MSGEQGIRVTVTDLATGKSQSTEIIDDYVLVTAGTCGVSSLQKYPSTGTHSITVKGVKGVQRKPDNG